MSNSCCSPSPGQAEQTALSRFISCTMPFAQSWSELHHQTSVDWFVSWQGNHKSNLPGIRMWRVPWWERVCSETMKKKMWIAWGTQENWGTCKTNSSVQGVKMSNGSARRTALHTKHIAFLRHFLLSHITSVSCWNSACPLGLRESLPRVKHSKCWEHDLSLWQYPEKR